MEGLFANWFLIFVRAGAMLSIFPLFSATSVPVRMRLALAGFMAFLMLPAMPAMIDISQASLLSLVGLLIKEVSIGLLFGWIVRALIFSVTLAGHFISSQIGLQLGGMIAPGSETPTEVMGVMLQMLAIALMVSLDLHYTLLVGFQQSYHVLPIGAGVLSDQLFDNVMGMAARTFLVAVKIASPIIAVGIVVNVLLCMLARAVPQMNVFMESFGIRLLIGIVLLGSVMQIAALEIANYLHQLPDDFVVAVRLLGLGG
ncbi:MAG: flagellar biosynthetic protein FliR [Verrucomicrobiales bacterium]|nr:flagellar biosynthetic protein FliR [Verrucomicrobiales bacterium]